MSVYSVDKLITEARRLAREYRAATGKTLPITGEIAINDAIRLLGMRNATNPDSGYDAELDYRQCNLRVQIKGRAIVNSKRAGHRLGQLKLEKDWDAIVLVIMNEDYEASEIYLADRDSVMEAVNAGKSRRAVLVLHGSKLSETCSGARKMELKTVAIGAVLISSYTGFREPYAYP